MLLRSRGNREKKKDAHLPFLSLAEPSSPYCPFENQAVILLVPNTTNLWALCLWGFGTRINNKAFAMRSRDEELEDFKTRINLTEYAAALGYLIDRKKSYGSSVLMRSGADIVVIGKNADNDHWIYWQVDAGKGGPGADAGSIIDFVQQRKGLNLGKVRQELRPWVGGAPLTRRPDRDAFVLDLKPITKDLMRVQARYEAANPLSTHRYLQQTRSIPASVLADPRFSDRMRVDAQGNVLFPHINRDGICGYEIKNADFTGFATGGEKGLWASRVGEGDTALVIAETAIDALSYCALHPDPNSRYLSTGGALNNSQPDLIRSAIERMPPEARIVVAVDNDDGGQTLFDRIQALFDDSSGGGRVLIDGRPQRVGDDWNDVLRASRAENESQKNNFPEPGS